MSKHVSRIPRLAPLAACLALAFGIDHSAGAVTLLVTDCGDGASSGTLRNTIAAAPTGSTVQIPATCTTITLKNSIVTLLDNISITGAGSANLTIDGGLGSTPSVEDRIFVSGGSIGLSGMTLRDAKYTGTAFPVGGCVYAKSNVVLSDVVATNCFINQTGATKAAKGGAIYAKGTVTIFNSSVSGNFAAASDSQIAEGGGIYAQQGVVAKYSTISDNFVVSGTSGGNSRGGGIFAAGLSPTTSTAQTLIQGSTISGNTADVNGAMQVAASGTNVYPVTIRNSTISENTARIIQAVGIYHVTNVQNSTIAFNHVDHVTGVAPAGLYSSLQISMESSVFAGNTGLGENDIFSRATTNPLVGHNNLIVATSNTAVPLGTLASCPKLGRLSDNGGTTQTIPVLLGSPLIDAGNNSNSLTDDQRGSGFSRVVGANADIGAFERQSPSPVDDEVFFSEFEGSCN